MIDRSRFNLGTMFVMSVLALGLLACADEDTGTPASAVSKASAASSRDGQAVSQPRSQQASDFLGAISAVAKEVTPAVVQVTNEQRVQGGLSTQGVEIPAGTGSGIVFDDQGHILTNNHVVEGASRLVVSFPDGRTFEAQLVGRDPQTDLAVLRISGDKIPVARLGPSDQLEVGEWVVAIGNALGLEGGPTVTTGVVGALGRTVQEPGDQDGPGPFLFDVIQTDAAINPGNSGGPLANLEGEVIGINTLVAGQAGPGVNAEGIGFAIAIDTARPLAEELIREGRVRHPYLGVGYVALSPAVAVQLGIEVTRGAMVMRVEPDGPAAQSGIAEGDVITEIDGQRIEGESDLARAIAARKPGDSVGVKFQRGGAGRDVQVRLGELPQR